MDALPLALLAAGVALGAGLGLLLARARSASECARLRAEAEAVLSGARAAEAALNERLRGMEERGAHLACDLDAAQGEARGLRDELRAESALRAGAEEKAARVPGLEQTLEAQARELSALRGREAELAARMEEERKAAAERQALLEDLQARLQDTFKALSAEALTSNNKNFLELAAQRLGRVQESAKGDLELRQKSIEGLVKPIRDSLTQVDQRIQDLEKQRVEAYAGLTQQVRHLMGEQGELRRETGRLVTALRRPTVRGRWGEIQLKRVVELAGMLDHCDFTEQTSVNSEDGRYRPDMVVRLPGGKNIVVDSKAPLEAYLNAQDAPDEEARAQLMKAHARQIREHLTKLGQKAYWEHLKPTPEFVVLFLPGEIFFSSALEHDPALIEEGVKQKVIPASPTTLIALLRAVYYGWQQEKVAKNAMLISESGRKLYKHVVVMTEHFAKVGKGLSGAVAAFNSGVKTMESGVLSQARRLQGLAAKEEKELPLLEPLEAAPREPQQTEDEERHPADQGTG